MMRKLTYFIVLASFTGLLWMVNEQRPTPLLYKGFLTVASLAVIYLVFKIVIEEILARGIKESKTKYSLRKTFSIVYIIVFLIVPCT